MTFTMQSGRIGVAVETVAHAPGWVSVPPKDLPSQMCARIQIANIGASSASHIEANARWFMWRDLPSESPIPRLNIIALPLSDEIKAGYWQTMNVLEHFIDVDDPDWDTSGDRYVAGYVRYSDASGRPRITAFCRRLNTTTRRFERVDDPAYEYED